MSKFSDLIQKKHEMLKVTMKVDPAACKNGEITHFQEYVGFVLAEKEFEKTYEKLLKKYSLQNEGFFDKVGGAIKNAAIAVKNKVVDDVTSSFKDPRFNPFVGQGQKPVDTSESDKIINEIKNKWLDVDKTVSFLIENSDISKSYKQLANEDGAISAYYNQFKKIFATKTESYKNSSFLNLISEAAPAPAGGAPAPAPAGGAPAPAPTPAPAPAPTPAPAPSATSTATSATSADDQQSVEDKQKNILLRGITLTDINTQIPIRNLQQKFLPQIEAQIEEENKKREEMRQDEFKSSAKDVWNTLVQQVEQIFKASRSNSLNQEKILWIFILAQPNQKIKLTNPSKQSTNGA